MDFSVMSSSPDNDASVQKPRAGFLKVVRNALFFCLFLLIFYTAAVLSMWIAWDRSNWTLFWDVTIGYLLIIPTVFFYTYLNMRFPNSTLSENHLLRAVLLNVDDRVALVDPVQPSQLDLGTSYRTMEGDHYDALASGMPTGAAAGCLSAIVSLLGLAPLLIRTNSADLSVSFFLTLLVFFSPVVPIALILSLINWRRARRAQRAITADSQGITWQAGGAHRHKHIAWTQARAFLRSDASVLPSSSSSVATTTYMLISPADVFVWIVPANPKVDVFLDSDRLARLIVTRTELPLRDVTQFMREIGTTGKNLPRLVESRGLTQGVAPDVLQDAYKVSQRKVVPARFAVNLLGLLLILVPFVVGGWMQWYDSSYITAFGQHIPNAPTLYSDSLTQADGDWPSVALSTDSIYGYSYVNGAYELHGSHADQSEWASILGLTFGSAAYSVTAVERGAVPTNETDGIGLTLHVNADESDFLMFDVQYDGEWQLYHYHEYGPNDPDNWEYLAGGSSSAINQGPGATNRLTAITYSDSVYLFANSQFIKQVKPYSSSYSVSRVDLSRTGSAGVFLNTSAMTGDFTDFKVSPVPPTEFWDVVRTLNPWHR